MFGDDRPVYTKQLGHSLLGSPNGFVLIQHLYAIHLPLGNKGEKLRSAVPYFKFLCHDAMGISCHEFKGNANE